MEVVRDNERFTSAQLNYLHYKGMVRAEFWMSAAQPGVVCRVCAVRRRCGPILGLRDWFDESSSLVLGDLLTITCSLAAVKRSRCQAVRRAWDVSISSGCSRK
jgi:hypothetical protein